MDADNSSIKFNNSELHFSNNFSKITGLKLNGVDIITNRQNEDFLLGGCYLMYPWTGRLSDIKNVMTTYGMKEFDSPFKSIYPLHGFYANSDRTVTIVSDNVLTTELKNSNAASVPYIKEEFTLGANSLTIRTYFENKSDSTTYFSYGYHPYVGINEECIDNLTIHSNMDKNILLSDQLVPKLNEKDEIEMTSCVLNHSLNQKEYDNAFMYDKDENPFVEIINKTGIAVRVESLNDASPVQKGSYVLKLNYFQIYTPTSRTSIAIEPTSSPVNSFNISFPSQMVELKPKERAEGVIRIKLTI